MQQSSYTVCAGIGETDGERQKMQRQVSAGVEARANYRTVAKDSNNFRDFRNASGQESWGSREQTENRCCEGASVVEISHH